MRRRLRDGHRRRAASWATHQRELAIPWQLRYRRAWWIRNARWHERCAADPRARYRAWHLEQAADSRATAERLVHRYYETGAYDRSSLWPYAECRNRMADPRWRNGLDIINCQACFDRRLGECSGCSRSYQVDGP